MTKKSTSFDFVIASKWPSGNLCIYTYGRQIQNGNKKSANELLSYVKCACPEDDWKIYKVTFKEVE